jgi:hypothetical protein
VLDAQARLFNTCLRQNFQNARWNEHAIAFMMNYGYLLFYKPQICKIDNIG